MRPTSELKSQQYHFWDHRSRLRSALTLRSTPCDSRAAAFSLFFFFLHVSSFKFDIKGMGTEEELQLSANKTCLPFLFKGQRFHCAKSFCKSSTSSSIYRDDACSFADVRGSAAGLWGRNGGDVCLTRDPPQPKLSRFFLTLKVS